MHNRAKKSIKKETLISFLIVGFSKDKDISTLLNLLPRDLLFYKI